MKTKSNIRKSVDTSAPGVQNRNEPARTISGTSLESAPAPAWNGVFFHGPQPQRNRDGNEIPVWSVFVGDTEAKPVSRIYHVFSFTKAESLAKAMSHDRQLELITEAQPAIQTA